MRKDLWVIMLALTIWHSYRIMTKTKMLDSNLYIGIIIFTHGTDAETPNSPPDGHAPNDLLQVKYEMLRRVHCDDFTVRRAAQLFGFSRPSFYQAQETFTRGGLGALVPQKRGPRRAHKLSQKIMAFIERTIAADPGADLVAAVQQEFGISVHRRSIERALARAKKKRR
jgi:transposase